MVVKKWCIVFVGRGTFYGFVTNLSGTTVTMTNVREIGYWSGVVTPVDLATRGPNHLFQNILSSKSEEVVLFGVTQIIAMSPEAVRAFDAIEDHPYPEPAPVVTEPDTLVLDVTEQTPS